MRKFAASLLFLPLVAACASTGPVIPTSTRPAASIPPQQPQVQPHAQFRTAKVMSLPGLEGVIGTDASGLVRQFGTPRLDVWEDDARKLQFAGQACVLDIWLYPPAPKGREVATWVEARRQTDGRDVDRAACVAALKR